MRREQIPLWWTIGLGLAAYLGSIDGDVAAALTFGSVFGIVFGGGMASIRQTPFGEKREAVLARRRKRARRHAFATVLTR